MPRIAMNWDNINQIGNPTKSAAVNNMIRGMALHQVQGSGVKSSARRAFEWIEFVTVLLATRIIHRDHHEHHSCHDNTTMATDWSH